MPSKEEDMHMNLGILGAGRIAVAMAITIGKLNESGNHTLQLYAVGSRDLDRAQAFADRYGVQRAFGSYEEMLADPALDLVYIATPHSHHYRQIKLCADYGKHVLCEKAFTVNARQAQAALDYARARGVLVTEAIWTRYQPMRQKIADALASGIIGTPKMLAANLCYATTHKERLVQPELAGGALLDVGVYCLNFAEMVFGRADGVQGSCTKNEAGVDLTDSITLTWQDGRMAVLNAACNCASDRQGVVYGTRGYLVVENINNPQGYQVFDGQHQLVEQVRCPAQLTGYEYEVLEAADAISRGLVECPSMPHSETVHMMEVMDHLRAQMGIVFPCEGLD